MALTCLFSVFQFIVSWSGHSSPSQSVTRLQSLPDVECSSSSSGVPHPLLQFWARLDRSSFHTSTYAALSSVQVSNVETCLSVQEGNLT